MQIGASLCFYYLLKFQSSTIVYYRGSLCSTFDLFDLCSTHVRPLFDLLDLLDLSLIYTTFVDGLRF